MLEGNPMEVFKHKTKPVFDNFSVKRFMQIMFPCDVEECDELQAFHTETLHIDDCDYLLSLEGMGANIVFEMKRISYTAISEDGREITANAVRAAKVEFLRTGDDVVPHFFQADDVALNMAGVETLEQLMSFVEKRRVSFNGAGPMIKRFSVTG